MRPPPTSHTPWRNGAQGVACVRPLKRGEGAASPNAAGLWAPGLKGLQPQKLQGDSSLPHSLTGLTTGHTDPGSPAPQRHSSQPTLESTKVLPGTAVDTRAGSAEPPGAAVLPEEAGGQGHASRQRLPGWGLPLQLGQLLGAVVKVPVRAGTVAPRATPWLQHCHPRVLATPLALQLPASAPGRAVEDGPGPGPAPCGRPGLGLAQIWLWGHRGVNQ